MTEQKMGAVELLAAVMNDVRSVGKKDVNEAQKFKFRGIDAVVNAVGPALRKHGGVIAPAVDSVTYESVASRNGGTLTVARLVVTYAVHAPNGEVVMGSVAAEAFDSGDKATAKAMSVAYRTFLLQVLCLPTDDPDPDSFTYEVADWNSAIESVVTKSEARTLYADAKKQNAPASVLDAISQKGSNLG